MSRYWAEGHWELGKKSLPFENGLAQQLKYLCKINWVRLLSEDDWYGLYLVWNPYSYGLVA